MHSAPAIMSLTARGREEGLPRAHENRDGGMYRRVCASRAGKELAFREERGRGRTCTRSTGSCRRSLGRGCGSLWSCTGRSTSARWVRMQCWEARSPSGARRVWLSARWQPWRGATRDRTRKHRSKSCVHGVYFTAPSGSSTAPTTKRMVMMPCDGGVALGKGRPGRCEQT
jgi:hypothetical protein